MSNTSPNQVIRNLQKLILELPNGEQRDKLEKQRQDLSDIVQKTVEANVGKRTAEYIQIAAEFEKANLAISKSVEDIKKIEDTINEIASCISCCTEMLKTLK